MKMTQYISLAVLMFVVTAVSTKSLQAQIAQAVNNEEETRYSEVDYRIAQGFVKEYHNLVGPDPSASFAESAAIPAEVSAALQVARRKEQYQVNGKFYGARLEYGLKGRKKVIVLLPLDSQNRLAVPQGHEKVYVIDIPNQVSSPCPPFCD
jgi:hypothetical protein